MIHQTPTPTVQWVRSLPGFRRTLPWGGYKILLRKLGVIQAGQDVPEDYCRAYAKAHGRKFTPNPTTPTACNRRTPT